MKLSEMDQCTFHIMIILILCTCSRDYYYIIPTSEMFMLTFDKLGDVDIDPETKSGDGASWYPIQKVFNFGIDITF